MDLKARNKAVNIVFSILIFVLTTAMFYGFYMSPIMLISGDGFGPQLTLTEMFESAIEYFKNFSNNASSGPDVFINGFMTNGMFLIMFAVNIIVYFVHYIVVTVKTAQGLAGKDVNKDIIRHLLSMITAVVVYIATLLSIYHVQSDTAALTIGTGPMVMLAICIVLFVLCAIIKVSGDDKKKPATRVFKVIISFLSLGATMAVLSSMYSVHGVSFNIRTLIVDTFTLLAAAAQGGSPDFKVIMTLSLLLLAICFVYAAHSTFSKLIVHSFEVEPTKKDKTKINACIR